ncbi:hypothetical protein EAF04_009780 [Stromatinia cepivora]|nr:hypothetical protein EAF04_009780 [Stromatinia cepivora]
MFLLEFRLLFCQVLICDNKASFIKTDEDQSAFKQEELDNFEIEREMNDTEGDFKQEERSNLKVKRKIEENRNEAETREL